MAQGGESGDIDGKYIACTSYDGIIYLSKDHGNTFNSIQIESENNLRGAYMSEDGSYLLVIPNNKNYVYISLDYGVTFEKKIISEDSSFTSYKGSISDDGKFMVVAAFRLDGKESISISNDFGETWNCKTIDFNDRWYGVSISNDGNYIVASANNTIAVSQDGGETFFKKDTSFFAGENVMSADGKYILICGSNGPLISRDFGNNFANDSSISKYVSRLDISSSGGQAFCITTDNVLYKSTDYAHTFEEVTLSFTPAIISGSYDFKYVVAMDTSGYIHISNDYGITFTKTSNKLDGSIQTLVMNKYIKE